MSQHQTPPKPPLKSLCFLVGAPRSGTTWIQRLLQSHPAICGGEESHFFTLFGYPIQAAPWMSSERNDREVGPLVYTGREAFEAAIRDVWDRIFANLYAAHPDASVHLEKTPNHALHLDEITRMFPEAKIVFLTRDSRAVTASLVHAGKSWGSGWAPDNAREAAILWHTYVTAVRDWQARHPDHPVLTVRYEDALADTGAALERMLRFVLPDGTAPDTERVLARFAEAQADRTDPAGFARLRGDCGWREDLSLKQKLTVWRYTRKEMRALGYGIGPV